jgi:hypothetical protein
MRNQAWQFGATFKVQTTSDGLYHIRTYLEGLGVAIEDVTGIYVHGTQQDEALSASLSALTGRVVSALDPLSVVDHYVEGLSTSFSIGSYSACIGANLRDVYP